MNTIAIAPQDLSVEHALSRPKVLAAAGIFLAAVFVILAWGALHTSAFGATATTASPGATQRGWARSWSAVAPATIVHTVTAAGPSAASPAVAASPAPVRRWGRVSAWGGANQASTSVAASSVAPVTSSAVSLVEVDQCNYMLDTPGQAVACNVTVTNNLNLATGAGSATVITQVCGGAAGAAKCNTPVTNVLANNIVNMVNQCNYSANGGGGTVTCNVAIINTITGAATPTSATVDQCIGSGAGGGALPLLCTPQGATTSATVTQCNGSANGGGATKRVICTVDPASQVSSALTVTVNQCNNSANGGGSLVICTVSEGAAASTLGLFTTAPGTAGGTTGTGGATGATTGPGGTIETGETGGTGGTTGGTGGTIGTGETISLDTELTSGGTGITPGIATGTNGLPTTPLAFTGSETLPMTLVGLLAIALGGLLVLLGGWATRRRPNASL